MPIRFEVDVRPEAHGLVLRPDRHRGRRGRARRGQGHLRPPAGHRPRPLREERRALPRRCRSARCRSRRPTSGWTPPSPGPRWASTRAWPRTRCWARASSPASAPPARASGPASPGSSAATRCGRRWPSTPTATSPPRAPPSSSSASSSAPTARSRTRSRRAPALVPWFTDYKYPWESADATPLYVIAQADHWRASGDLALPARVVAVDRQGLALLGGHRHRRQRPHREHEVRPRLDRGQPALPAARGDLPAGHLGRGLPGGGGAGRRHGGRGAGRLRRARSPSGRGPRSSRRTGSPAPGYYAFATALAKPEKVYDAEPGPRRAARQARIEALRGPDAGGRGHGAARGAAVVARRSTPSARSPRSTTWARRPWPPTGARASSRRAASCTTRCRTTTARCGRSSRAGPRSGRTATAGRTSATRP